MKNNISMTRKVFLFLLIASLVCGFLITSCSQSDTSPILGTWVLTSDPDSPDSPPDDMVEFKKDGKVDCKDTKGVYLSGTYEENDNGVLLRCNVNGTEKTIEMTYSENKSTLLNPSGAKYTKK